MTDERAASRVTPAMAQEFVEATDALSDYDATYSQVSDAAMRGPAESYEAAINAFFAERKPLEERERKAVEAMAVVTGKDQEATRLGALSGLLLARLRLDMQGKRLKTGGEDRVLDMQENP